MHYLQIKSLKPASILALIIFSLACQVQKEGMSNSNGQIGEIHVREFGAIPNDGLDDADGIQAAIDYAIRSQRVSLIQFEPGIYDLGKGIIIGNRQSNGEYFFTGLQLSGHIPAFSGEQRFGATTVFKAKGSGFTLAVQLGRNVLIENIVFDGDGLLFNSASEIVGATSANWTADGKRNNRYSPHCAIAIDPFHKDVGNTDRYPGFNPYYSNSSSGGTSMVTIQGCSFFRYYIAIANNPSNGVSNGDNIRAENCHVSNCRTFWSCGQTQSRNNSINNIYALSIHTFVSGVEIGKRQGTPPFISNVNIAGFCKYVFNIHTLFSGLSISNSHLESIWSLGYALANTVSFDGCQIQFRQPDEDIFSPPFHLYSAATVDINNCGIEYFSNCTTLAPIMIRSRALNIVGGWIEGGVIAANGITNEGGEEIHNVDFKNVVLKCLGSIAGITTYKKPIENAVNQVFLGSDILKTNDGSEFSNTGSTYHIIPLGEVKLRINEKQKTGVFTFEKTGLIKEDDNLFTTQTVLLEEPGPAGYGIRPALGFISHINGNEVFVKCIPEGIKEGNMQLYIVEYPVFVPPVWGTLSVNNSTITDVISYSHSLYPKAGTRIFGTGFPNGAYVLKANPESRTITMSVNALQSVNDAVIRNSAYDQNVYIENWSDQSVPVIKEGAVIHLEKPFHSSYRLVNTKKAVLNTPYKASLKPIE